MSIKITPKYIELIETIVDCDYGASQVTLAEKMDVSRNRVNKMISNLRKVDREELLSFI
tara:strand:+ start:1620 stop:1796 length:177 start_codon:yes stop_codon:yes gene_type:complete